MFEVVFPVAQRGVHASVGVGHDNVPLTLNKSCSLVGNCKESWALDLSTRRAVHAAGIKKYPSTQVSLHDPPRDYLYRHCITAVLILSIPVDIHRSKWCLLDCSFYHLQMLLVEIISFRYVNNTISALNTIKNTRITRS